MFLFRLIGSANRRRLHRIARKYFGLQITTVPDSGFDMWHYEMIHHVHSTTILLPTNACGIG